MAENIYPSAGRKSDVHISQVASENSYFPIPKTYTGVYTVLVQFIIPRLTAVCGSAVAATQ